MGPRDVRVDESPGGDKAPTTQVAKMSGRAVYQLLIMGVIRFTRIRSCPGDGKGQQNDDQPQERHPDPPHEPSGRTAHYAKTNP